MASKQKKTSSKKKTAIDSQQQKIDLDFVSSHKIPQEITDYFGLEFDIPEDQYATYPETMDVSNGSTEQEGMSVAASQSSPPFEYKDGIYDEGNELDMITLPSPLVFGHAFNHIAGDLWHVVKPDEEIRCMNDGGLIPVGRLVCRYPEESDWKLETMEGKFWGYFYSLRSMWRWMIECNQINQGHAILAMSNMAINIFGVKDLSGPAPSKQGLLQGWNGSMPLEEYRKLCDDIHPLTIGDHNSRMISNPRFIPTPVVRQIDIYNQVRREAASATLDQVYGFEDAVKEKKDALLEKLGGHANVAVVETGIWFDTVNERWVDVHNETGGFSGNDLLLSAENVQRIGESLAGLNAEHQQQGDMDKQ